ncbi:Uncharacterised protein [Yersinia enterocolitica]|nr:Uncharacterised protein [Yersinia enterocolitica]
MRAVAARHQNLNSPGVDGAGGTKTTLAVNGITDLLCGGEIFSIQLQIYHPIGAKGGWQFAFNSRTIADAPTRQLVDLNTATTRRSTRPAH